MWVIEHLRAARSELLAEGAQFALTKADVLGHEMDVFATAPPSMRFVWELATGYGDATYIVYEDESYTYNEIDARVRALAHHLRNEQGVGSGDRVAIAMRNYPEWVVAYWGVLATGAAVVGMNAWWTSAEMNYGLTDSQPKVLIADDERLARVASELEELRKISPLHVMSVRSDSPLPDNSSRWEDVVDPDNAPDGLPDADIAPDDDACIFYTSGTTGFPKGAQLTHRGCVHNLMNLAFMTTAIQLAASKADPDAAAAAAEAVAATAPPQTCFMAPTPLFHVTANNCLLHPATLTGAKIVLTYKWDAARALELIERERVTNFSGVPTMSREMLLHPDWETRDTSSLQGMGGGGAPLQPDLVEKIDDNLPTGAPSTGYGLTETCGIVTANGSAFYLAKPSSCGPIVPTLQSKLIDELGNDVPAGPEAVGELCVKGAVVIKGYLNKPEATAEAIPDRWFRTGDIAKIDDDGFVFIVDRAKDMVLRGGENIYCSEVEAAIYKHPAVAEAAVFSVPDDRLGEDVGVAIVLVDGESLDNDGLRAHLEPLLAKFKIPSHVWFLDEPLPQNANGKFVKRTLQEQLLGADN